MPFLLDQIVRIQLVVYLLSSLVSGNAVFTNPSGPDNSTTLTIGENYIVEWKGSGVSNSDYTELSLGVTSASAHNTFWLLSNVFGYAGQNYQYTVSLGNGLTVADGPFAFILVNGTSFGEEVQSPQFAIKNAIRSTTLPSSTLVPTTSATTSPTSKSTPSFSSSPAVSSSSGLSTGAQAGIGVGVALGALVVLGAAFMFWRRRRRAAAGRIHDAPDIQVDESNRKTTNPMVSPAVPYRNASPYSPGGHNHLEVQKLQRDIEALESDMAQVHEAPVHVIHEAP